MSNKRVRVLPVMASVLLAMLLAVTVVSARPPGQEVSEDLEQLAQIAPSSTRVDDVIGDDADEPGYTGSRSVGQQGGSAASEDAAVDAPNWEALMAGPQPDKTGYGEVDLLRLPFLTHYDGDAGPYATAAIAIVNDPDNGPNVSFHRCLRLDSTRLAARIVERRGADTALKKTPDDLPVAICIGLPLHVLLAASMAPDPGVDELAIAQALAPTPVVPCLTNSSLFVPAEAEFVLEGRITHHTVAEGPFVDLTETWDIVRQQPVIEIDRITHRRDAIYHALLPGMLEHKMLMGMPKEPSIYAAVSQVARCSNVSITPGGTSWLHAVVQIDKQRADDGRKAAEAAFRGHPSLKHVVVVDADVDLYDPHDVEWAIATRFQADRDLLVWENEPSSSLDPSAIHVPGQKSRSAKMGLDATIPWDEPHRCTRLHEFQRVALPKADLSAYL